MYDFLFSLKNKSHLKFCAYFSTRKTMKLIYFILLKKNKAMALIYPEL